jgi:hypothetical protein
VEPRTEKRRLKVAPWAVLFFLSPAIGELLSGSSPPVEFFSPFGLTILCVLYGGGALLVRELARRWGGGWRTAVILGAAYGAIEEGLMVKSWFDPNWMDLGLLGTYGRALGVNWVWAAGLTLYHTAYSIGIPILLTTLIFPAQRSAPWLNRRGIIALGALFIADVLVGYLWLTPYRPPALAYLLTLIGTALLLLLARRTARREPSADARPLGSPWRRALLGFGWGILLFFLLWALPGMGLPVPVVLASFALFAWGSLALGARLERRGVFSAPMHLLALASGALTFLILLAPLQELDKTRVDNTAGMSLVGLAAAVFLVWIGLRLRRKPVADAGPRGMY